MRILTILLLLAATAPELAYAQHQVVKSQQDGQRHPLRYLFYSPVAEGAEGETSYPMVLFLHGGGEGGDDIDSVKKHGLPKRIESGRQFPFFVVSPQNPSQSQFWDDQQLIRLVDEVVAKYSIDTSRIYLTGLSRGAYGAWRLAIQNPNRFAALVPISGGGPLPYVKKLASVPTWVFHGERDTVIPVEESLRMVNALRQAGGNVKLTIYPDARHDAWTRTYDNEELYDWLLKQRRTDSETKQPSD